VSQQSQVLEQGAADEWQRDWARQAALAQLVEVIAQYGGGTGVAFAWEQQLLNTQKSSKQSFPRGPVGGGHIPEGITHEIRERTA
jgi:hypothetical protein